MKIVIVGGGTAGWMTAAALASLFPRSSLDITLVESEKIGTIGVGEASIPQLKLFNEKIGIDEADFINATHATFKLGIQFENWGGIGETYSHPFEYIKKTPFGVPLHSVINAHNTAHKEERISSLDDIFISSQCMRNHRFSQEAEAKYSYAYHLDATAYASLLRDHSEARGVTRIEGTIANVQSDLNGQIASVDLENGSRISGDLFIDCSGFKGLLIKETLKAKFTDWSKWLICDSAIAAPSTPVREKNRLPPFTRAIAKEFGWRWEIPLQHRNGNGIVYNSTYANDSQVEQSLASGVIGDIGDIRKINFTAGMIESPWTKNCVAIGLSSGFLEPLESTSIYLIQRGIIAICDLLSPTKEAPCFSVEGLEFNRQMRFEYERIRDFIILHYKATNREDSEFWKYHKYMEIPDSLSEIIENYETLGYIEPTSLGLFLAPSWHIVFSGQNIQPKMTYSASNLPKSKKIKQFITQLQTRARVESDNMPYHAQTLDHLKKRHWHRK